MCQAAYMYLLDQLNLWRNISYNELCKQHIYAFDRLYMGIPLSALLHAHRAYSRKQNELVDSEYAQIFAVHEQQYRALAPIMINRY